jgi:hypothetical protein
MKLKYRYIDQAKKILTREEGTIRKDWGGRLPVVLIYANAYRLGMSSLAMHSVYRLFNDQGRRAYSLHRISAPAN